MTRGELSRASYRVVLITLAMLAGAYLLLGVLLVLNDFKDPILHLTLATVFTLILTPIGVFPLVVMSDRLRKVKEELEALLRLDPLTELPNRRAFFERAETSFQGPGPVTLMMIDIDHFKQVNDNFGHDIGDGVLRAVGESIQHIVATAASGDVGFAARIGGEEFAVLIEGLTDADAKNLAARLVTTIAGSPVQGGGRSISVTVSVGLAHRGAGDGPGAVLRAADNACYRAKRLGRNQWSDGAAAAVAGAGGDAERAAQSISRVRLRELPPSTNSRVA